jgi:hypothetical protein
MSSKYFLLILILLLASEENSFVIKERKVSPQDLEAKVKIFNDWYHQINPNSLGLSLKLNEQLGNIILVSNSEINEDDVYFLTSTENVIRFDNIYSTPLGETLKEVEETFGFDDVTNFALYLIYEIHNPDSKWKPYLDILYSSPVSLIEDYWNNKKWVESELKNTSIPKKTFEKRLYIDKKARGIHEAFTIGYPDVFNKEIFTVENIDWALITVESRMIYVGYEGMIIPMLDNLSYSINKKKSNKGMSGKIENNIISFKAIDFFPVNSEIYDNPNFNNEKLLISNGKISIGSGFDCYNLILSFSQRKEDQLSKKRIDFFSKYFLFDQGHFDILEECVRPSNPFNRRLLFFYYVLMMDEQDLQLSDPKRNDLEQDRILLEFVISQLRSNLVQFDGSVSDIEKKYVSTEDKIKKAVIGYKLEQLKMLTQIIGVYEDNYYKLVKEDSL